MANDPNAVVQEAIDVAIGERGEIGIQVAAYLGNELAVDVSGGLADERGYVNRCVNDIRRRPSQPLIQWRFHPHTVHRDRRLRSTQGPSDA